MKITVQESLFCNKLPIIALLAHHHCITSSSCCKIVGIISILFLGGTSNITVNRTVTTSTSTINCSSVALPQN